ncbi:MAG: methylenetetrahydrofolate reductase C-terminal domain-containing protein [Proteobacteria bacterium]|nr:methylenetetrahydrofolate reductase C-terminal domain-containing protein [Pseudomonadota bacterium]MBU1714976.1 methylenetetrahydrofolate reductase C-terminal domain-containing protein [Pseudomonadota bacterium]
MIIAERKPIDEIVGMIQETKRVLVLGCRGCVTVCSAGGEREVEILASLLRLGMKKAGKKVEIIESTLVRQCDKEYIDGIDQWEGKYDAIVSMACGVGVNFIANLRPLDKVYPAVNTSFFGGSAEQGVWTEQCAGCGNCILHLTGGLCPVARCAKSLMNGPCGGSVGGRCEIHQDVDCIWQSIHDRLARTGKKADMDLIAPIRDWSSAGHGGPRKIVRDDLTV